MYLDTWPKVLSGSTSQNQLLHLHPFPLMICLRGRNNIPSRFSKWWMNQWENQQPIFSKSQWFKKHFDVVVLARISNLSWFVKIRGRRPRPYIWPRNQAPSAHNKAGRPSPIILASRRTPWLQCPRRAVAPGAVEASKILCDEKSNPELRYNPYNYGYIMLYTYYLELYFQVGMCWMIDQEPSAGLVIGILDDGYFDGSKLGFKPKSDMWHLACGSFFTPNWLVHYPFWRAFWNSGG